MNVGAAWLTYFLVVLISFIIFALIFRGVGGCNSWCSGPVFWNALFFALLLGAIAVFFISHCITLKTSGDKTWYSILLIVAYVLPLIFLLVALFKGGWWEAMSKDEPETSTTIECDESGCTPRKFKSKLGKDTVKVFFD